MVDAHNRASTSPSHWVVCSSVGCCLVVCNSVWFCRGSSVGLYHRLCGYYPFCMWCFFPVIVSGNLDPFYFHSLTLRPAWIDNHIHYNVWDEITHLSQNVEVAVLEGVSNFITHFTGHVITQPCWHLSQTMLVKGHSKTYSIQQWPKISRIIILYRSASLKQKTQIAYLPWSYLVSIHVLMTTCADTLKGR